MAATGIRAFVEENKRHMVNFIFCQGEEEYQSQEHQIYVVQSDSMDSLTSVSLGVLGWEFLSEINSE